jgi:hypothetical protein
MTCSQVAEMEDRFPLNSGHPPEEPCDTSRGFSFRSQLVGTYSVLGVRLNIWFRSDGRSSGFTFLKLYLGDALSLVEQSSKEIERLVGNYTCSS